MGKLVMKLASRAASLENEDPTLPVEGDGAADAAEDVLENMDPETIEGALESDEMLAAEVEAVEDVSAIQNDLDTVDRLEQQAAGLEDLATVLDHVNDRAAADGENGGMSDNEAVLTEIASDMAVVGTDLTTDEDVVPGLESFIGASVSTEGLKETAKKYWAKIWEFIKGIWTRIKAYFGNSDARVATYKKRAAALKLKADKLTGDVKKDVNVTFPAAVVSVGGKHLKSLPEVEQALNKSFKIIEDIAGSVVDPIAGLAKDVNEAAKAKITSSDDAKKLLEKVNGVIASALKGIDSKVSEEVLFMGGKKLTHNLKATLAKSSNDPVVQATTLRSADISVSRDSTASGSVEISPLTISSIKASAKEAYIQTTKLEKLKNGAVKQLLDAKFDKLELNIEKDADQGAAAVKAIMQYGTLIAKLGGKVIPAVFNVWIANIGTVLMIAEKSATQYSSK